MKIKLIFAWYDIWVGVFYDQKKRRIYIFFLPTIGIVIQLYGKIDTVLGEYKEVVDKCQECLYNRQGTESGMYCINNCVKGSKFKSIEHGKNITNT
jgi:hypothetical protein